MARERLPRVARSRPAKRASRLDFSGAGGCNCKAWGFLVIVKLSLTVNQGPFAGRRFRLVQEGVYLFGRLDDLPGFLGDDDFLSGQHFEIEVRRTSALLRDVGSRNGTRLNGRRLKPTRFALRPDGQTRIAPDNDGDEILLQDRDTILAGATTLAVHIDTEATCAECGAPIPPEREAEHRWLGGALLCSACRTDMLERDRAEEQRAERHESNTLSMRLGDEAEAPAALGDEHVTCARCGVPFALEGAPTNGRPLLPVCPACRDGAAVLLHELESSLREGVIAPSPDEVDAALLGLAPAVAPAPPASAPPVLPGGPAPGVVAPATPNAGALPAPALPGQEFTFTDVAGAAASASAAEAAPTWNLADFELGARLEHGGPGQVRRARRHADGAELFLRIVEAPAANIAMGERFAHAFAPWLGRTHRRLVTAGAAGGLPGRVFVLHEAVGGRPLPRFVNTLNGPLGIPTVVELGLQILAALDALHQGGVVHGELKPECVLIAGDPAALDVRVADAGVTRTLLACGLLGREPWRPFLPSLAWLAPELAADPRAVTPATDLYAAAAILYRALTEQPPRTLPAVVSTDPSRVLVDVPVTPVRWYRTDLPLALEGFLSRALAAQPGERYPSAREMATALAATLDA